MDSAAFLRRQERFLVRQEAKKKRLRSLSGEQGHRCAYCSEKTWLPSDEKERWHSKGKRATIEHLKPQAHGGTYARINTVMACHKCNSKRPNDLTPEQFFELINDPVKWQAYRKKIARAKAKRDKVRQIRSAVRKARWMATGCQGTKYKNGQRPKGILGKINDFVSKQNVSKRANQPTALVT